MKFKANLSVPHTQLLYNLINPLSKLQPQYSAQSNSNASNASMSTVNSTIMYLDDDKMVLSTRGSSHKNDSEGIFCFAELITTDGIFTSHVIESVERDNAILMEVSITQFRTALKGVLSTQKQASGGGTMSVLNNDHEVNIKLAKRNGGLPHLCFDVRDPLTYSYNHRNSNYNADNQKTGVGVNYAIPVTIMKVEELQYHVPPRLGFPDVQLTLPKERPLRNVVERLRGISPHLYVEGSMNGILTLRIDSDGASIRTSFDKLVPIHEDCKSTQDINGDGELGDGSQMVMTQEPAKCTVKVDSKKLHACLHWQSTLGISDISSAVLCMFENEMLVLDVTLNPEIGRFMQYIPVHYLSNEEMNID